MEVTEIDRYLLVALHENAKRIELKRYAYDLRNSEKDNSQRLVMAMEPGTEVRIHRHEETSESLFCLCGCMDVIFFDESPCNGAGGLNNGVCGTVVIGGQEKNVFEVYRSRLCPSDGKYGVQIPMGVWHSVEVHEPSTIFEAKDGRYAPDSCLGDLKKQITYLIGMERHSGSMDAISPLYVARMLNVPVEAVEKEMREMGV